MSSARNSSKLFAVPGSAITAGAVGAVTQPVSASAPATTTKCKRVLMRIPLALGRRGRTWRALWKDAQPALGARGHLRVIARRVGAVVGISPGAAELAFGVRRLLLLGVRLLGVRRRGVIIAIG